MDTPLSPISVGSPDTVFFTEKKSKGENLKNRYVKVT